MFQLRSCILAMITLFGSAAVARADIIFSDFGPNNGYDSSIQYNFGPGYGNVAFNFTSSQNYSLTQIGLALDAFANAHVTVNLWTESNGNLGTKLDSWTIDVPKYAANVYTISGITGITLTAGASYFLQVTSDADAFWYGNNQGATGIECYSEGCIAGNTEGAYDLLSPAPIPEPASLALLGTGLVAAAGAVRRRRNRSKT